MSLSRRSFLQSSVASAAATGMFFSSTSGARGQSATESSSDEKTSAAENSQSPNEQPIFGYIGTGIRFHTALGRGGTEFGPGVALADVDLVQLGRAQQVLVDQARKHERPLVIHAHEDYRHVLDNKDIDAVFIATPDHWHTKQVIEAMQAGKDVYCEKPVTLTIKEGQQILQVMDQTKRILQVGTQQRTEFDHRFAQAAALVRHGRVGELQRMTVAIGGSRECPPLPKVAPPKQLNWDLWCGQAPLVPYREGDYVDVTGWGAGFPLGRAHRYYRWWYEYSGGKLTDWGAHHVDIAMWASDKLGSDIGLIEIDPVMVEHPVPFQDGYPTEHDRFNAATKFKVNVSFADGLEMVVVDSAQEELGFDNGIMFQGSEGRFLVNRGKIVGKPVELLEENPLPEDWLKQLYGRPAPASHIAHFVDCIKSRETPISDALSHHRILAVCHAVNIAMRLGRKVVFDPATDTFVDDYDANSFLDREQRKGYEIKV